MIRLTLFVALLAVLFSCGNNTGQASARDDAFAPVVEPQIDAPVVSDIVSSQPDTLSSNDTGKRSRVGKVLDTVKKDIKETSVKVEKGLEKAADKVGDAAKKAGTKVKDGAAKAAEKVEGAAKDVKENLQKK